MGQITASFDMSGTSPLHIEALNIKQSRLHKLPHIKLLKNISGNVSEPAAQPLLILRKTFLTAQTENIASEIEFDLDLLSKVGWKPLSLVNVLASNRDSEHWLFLGQIQASLSVKVGIVLDFTRLEFKYLWKARP